MDRGSKVFYHLSINLWARRNISAFQVWVFQREHRLRYSAEASVYGFCMQKFSRARAKASSLMLPLSRANHHPWAGFDRQSCQGSWSSYLPIVTTFFHCPDQWICFSNEMSPPRLRSVHSSPSQSSSDMLLQSMDLEGSTPFFIF